MKKTLAIFFIVINIWGCSSDYGVEKIIAQNDLQKLKKIIKNRAVINNTDYKGRTPLYLAALYGRAEITKYLLNNGADPLKRANWKDYATPLHVAATQGHLTIVGMFVDKGVNVNCKTMNGITPLISAARHRKPEVVELLIKHGGNLNVKDSHGKGVLHGYDWSKEVNDDLTKTIDLLITAGADVNSLSDEGETPLMCISSIGAIDAVKKLVESGAIVDKKNSHGLNAIDMAENNGHDKVADFLRSVLNKGRI